MKKLNTYSLFSRAYVRDGQAIYDTDAMLIAVITHTTDNNRDGFQGKIVRKLMHDVNEV